MSDPFKKVLANLKIINARLEGLEMRMEAVEEAVASGGGGGGGDAKVKADTKSVISAIQDFYNDERHTHDKPVKISQSTFTH